MTSRSTDTARLVSIDLARTLAIAMMFTAHVAPSDGPARILLATEFLTAPLFALLVGAAAQLAHDRAPDPGMCWSPPCGRCVSSLSGCCSPSAAPRW
ncbi:hypothetical protein JSY14_01715 [Brachybacterium sp. EF45031]|uniref:hypothetical protein n=1 Tax=Brachybacterium sillae TaxID=2810536 RepID=UPI00217E8CC7|nr:hypothetical protein [Brachybacterium sillae]MCS6710799.1 hypothetical protein [Brachybacterium sillae]